jgi:hypothetical protein
LRLAPSTLNPVAEDAIGEATQNDDVKGLADGRNEARIGGGPYRWRAITQIA